MKCEEVIELMHRELDGDLNPKEQQGFLKHLASCPDCDTLFDQLKALTFQLESLPKVTPAYNIVDKLLPILDEVDQTQNEQGLSLVKNSEQPNHKSVMKKRNRKLWIPGLALAATFFIALLISNSTSDMDNTSQDAYDQSAESYVMEAPAESDNGDHRLAGTSEEEDGDVEMANSGLDEPSADDPIFDEAGDTSGYKDKNERNEQVEEGKNEEASEEENDGENQMTSFDFASLDEDYVEYNSPDGVYSAYEGFGNEDIRIKKEDRPYYMTKYQWEKPWEVISIEWISNHELYYILYHPEQDEQQYWMLYADERTEEQLEEPYVTEAE